MKKLIDCNEWLAGDAVAGADNEATSIMRSEFMAGPRKVEGGGDGKKLHYELESRTSSTLTCAGLVTAHSTA